MMDNEEGDGIIYSINKEQISTLVQVQITLLASKPFFSEFQRQVANLLTFTQRKQHLNGNFTVFKPHECVCVCVQRSVKH